MEEMGNVSGRGRGKSASVPVLCRIYIKRAALGEDGIAVGADGKKKKAVDVHQEYFDLLKTNLPPSFLRQQGHTTAVMLGGYQLAGHAAPLSAIHVQQHYDVVQADAPADFPDHHHFQHDNDALLPLVIHGHYQGYAHAIVHGQQNSEPDLSQNFRCGDI
jgi:hypothetical protein